MKPPDENPLLKDLFGDEPSESDATLSGLLRAAKRKRQSRLAKQVTAVLCVIVVLVGLGVVAFRRTRSGPREIVINKPDKTVPTKARTPSDPAAVFVAKIRTRRFQAVQTTEPVLAAPKPKFAIHASVPPPKPPLAGVPVQVITTQPFLGIVETVPSASAFDSSANLESVLPVRKFSTDRGSTVFFETQPNNVDLIGDQTLLSALEKYEPVLVGSADGEKRLFFADPEASKILFRPNRAL